MSTHVVGALLVREGSYAVQVELSHYLLPGARLQPVTMLAGDVIKPFDLMRDAIIMMQTSHLPPGVRAFHVVQDD